MYLALRGKGFTDSHPFIVFLGLLRLSGQLKVEGLVNLKRVYDLLAKCRGLDLDLAMKDFAFACFAPLLLEGWSTSEEGFVPHFLPGEAPVEHEGDVPKSPRLDSAAAKTGRTEWRQSYLSSTAGCGLTTAAQVAVAFHACVEAALGYMSQPQTQTAPESTSMESPAAEDEFCVWGAGGL